MRGIILLPLLALVGCGSDAPSTPGSKDPRCAIGEFGASAVGVVQGRLVDQTGAPVAGASVNLIVSAIPMSNVVHETGTAVLTQADGRFEILVQRLGQRSPAVSPDTVSSELRAVRSSGMSATVQPYRVLVRFNACVAGALQTIVPTTVELTWRDIP